MQHVPRDKLHPPTRVTRLDLFLGLESSQALLGNRGTFDLLCAVASNVTRLLALVTLFGAVVPGSETVSSKVVLAIAPTGPQHTILGQPGTDNILALDGRAVGCDGGRTRSATSESTAETAAEVGGSASSVRACAGDVAWWSAPASAASYTQPNPTQPVAVDIWQECGM